MRSRLRLRALCVRLPLLVLLPLACLVPQRAHAQAITASSYPFAVSSGAVLEDMTGATQLIGSDQDNSVSTVQNIGFDFWFAGVRQTQYSVCTDGSMRFGSTPILDLINDLTFTNNMPQVAPYWDNLMTGTNGSVRAKVVGSTPARKLVIEWQNMQVPRVGFGQPGAATFQLWLSEGGGRVDIVYGSGMALNTADGGASIGFSSAVNSLASVTASAGTVSYTTADNANTAAIAAGTAYGFTPPVPADPTGLGFTAIGAFGMTLTWTDNASNEAGYAIFRSLDGITYDFAAQTAANATSGAVTGLTPGTTYFWKVFAVSSGSLSAGAATGTQGTVAPLSGVRSVGPTGTYASLTAALADVATVGVGGALALELQSGYTSAAEPGFPVVVGPVPGASATNTLTIRPQTGATNLTLTSGSATATLDFQGASFTTVDGRPGGAGTAKHLTVENTSTSGIAVRFQNESHDDALTFVTLRGVNTSTSGGVVVIGTTTGANGNDAIALSTCDVGDGATTPLNGVLLSGSTLTPNDGCTVTGCNIFNFFNDASGSAGVRIGAGVNGCTVSGNSFYQTVSRAAPTASIHEAILVGASASATGILLSGNVIGGSAPNAGGAPWTVSSGAARFIGIDAAAAGLSSTVSIQGNTVANFAWTSSTALFSLPGTWCGIRASTPSLVGTVTGNTIGAGTGTGSIVLTGTTTTAGVSYGIVASSGSSSPASTIANNTIGSITVGGSSTSNAHSFTGIAVGSAGATVSGNLVGSLSTASSIAVPATSGASNITGIDNQASLACTVSGNTVANLANGYTGGGIAQTRGIVCSGPSATVTGNTIRMLSAATTSFFSFTSAPVIGLLSTSTTAPVTISQNVVHTLSTSATSASSTVYGMLVSGPSSGTNLVSRNFVHSLSVASTSTGASITGISVQAGTITYQNNMIRVGVDANGASIATPCGMFGINEAGGSSSYLHNSVFVGGTAVGTPSLNTFAFTSSVTSGTRVIQDNIFWNARSNSVSGTSRHYAIAVGGTTPNPAGLTCSYNDLFVSGTNGAVGRFNGGDQTTLAAWQTATGLDLSSISGDPKFVNATGAAGVVDLHIDGAAATPIEHSGIAQASVTDDFDGQSRAGLTPVDLGADAGTFTGIDVTAPVIVYTPLANTISLAAQTLTATIADGGGVPASGVGLPVLYWRINAGAYQPATGVSLGGDQYQFSFGSGVVAGNVVSYYIVAQDVASTPNLSVNPSAGAAGFTANPPAVSTPPTTPSSYTIIGTLAGTFTVGAGADYATLTAAVADLNAKVLVGPVTFLLVNNAYSETFPLTINANSGSSAVNTVTFAPSAGHAVSIVATSTSPLFVFNGCDFLTFDGSNNGGTSRDWTLFNTSTVFGSAVLWAQTATGSNGATNLTFKNLNLQGNSLGASATFCGVGFGSTLISQSSQGTGNNNNTVQNCAIDGCAFGVFSQGSSSTKTTGTTITQNIIGATTPVRQCGIFVGFDNGAQISRNTIVAVSGSTSELTGINLGVVVFSTGSVSGNEVINASVTRNTVASLTATSGNSTAGILTSPSASGTTLIANNTVGGLSAASTANAAAAGLAIGTSTGSTTQIYHNSVSLSASMPSVTGATYAIMVSGFTPTLDLRNNAFVNTATTASNGRSYAIGLGYSSTPGNYANLTSSNNDLFVPSRSNAFVGVTGSLSINFTNRATLTDWNAETGRDVPGVSWSALPPFISATDLHMMPGAPTVLEAHGTPLAAVATDLDGDARNVSTPDIGADEGSFTAWFTTDLAGTGFVEPTNGSTRGAGVPFTPQATFTNGGTATLTNTTVRYRILDPSSVEIYNQIATIASVGPAVSTTVSFPATTFPAAGTYTLIANAEAAGDQASGNDQVTGSVTVLAALAGPYNIGVGGDFTTITAALAQLALVGASGAVEFQLTDASYPSETFPITVQPFAGASASRTLTIHPKAGVSTSLSSIGTVFKINGADFVTLDGSNNGTASRNLTLTTTLSGSVAGVWVSSPTASNPATNNTIKNVIVRGSASTGSLMGIYSGGSTISTTAPAGDGPGITAALAPNSNNSYVNNQISKVLYGIFLSGVSAASPDQNALVSGNALGSPTSGDGFGTAGIWALFQQNATITQNDIQNVTSTNAIEIAGIELWDCTGAAVTRNSVHDCSMTSAGGRLFGLRQQGTAFVTAGAPSANLYANNVLSGLSSSGQSFWAMSGINLDAGFGDRVVFNSVSLSGTLSGNSSTPAAAFSNGSPAGGVGATSIDVRDNVFSVTGTAAVAAKVYAHYTNLSSWSGSTVDFNDLFVAPTGSAVGLVGRFAGADASTLAAWRTATGQEAHSLAASPLFVGTTDLHIAAPADGAVSPLANAGTPVSGVTVDVDGATRSLTTPDIGADEFATFALAVSGANGSVAVSPLQPSYNPGSTVTLTATPDAGFAFAGWSGDASGAVNPLGVTMSADKSIIASFVAETFTITASAGSGGAISPSGAVVVNSGASQAFTITPASGFHVDDVLVDGASVGAVTTFTFTNVTASHTIAATFAADPVSALLAGLPAPTRLAVVTAAPNPFAGHVEIAFGSPRAQAVRAVVCDARGRQVADLGTHYVTPGYTVLRWDGHLQDGARAAAGLYFLRLEGASERATYRITYRP